MAEDDVFKEWEDLKDEKNQRVGPRKKLLYDFLKQQGKKDEAIRKAFEDVLTEHNVPFHMGQNLSSKDADRIIEAIRASERKAERAAETALKAGAAGPEGVAVGAGMSRARKRAAKNRNKELEEEQKERKKEMKARAKEEKRRRKEAAKNARDSKLEVVKARAGYLNPNNYDTGPGSLKWIVLIAAFFHIVIDGFYLDFKSGIAGPLLIFTLLRLLVYGLLAFFAASQIEDARVLWGMVAFELLVPFFIELLTSSFIGLFDAYVYWIILFWLFTPVLAIYLSYKDKGLLIRIWGIAIVLSALVFLILSGFLDLASPGAASAVPGSALTSTSFDVGNALEIGGDMFVEAIQNAIDRVRKIWTVSIDYATGGYYTSMVEDQQGEPVGLRIENMRFDSDYYFEGYPVYLWADIQGKSFKEEIEVITGCRVRDGPEGNTTPELLEIFYQGGDVVQCEFDQLPVGYHNVILEAGFNFDTWAYVTYTFVDQQTMRNYFRQDKDINRDLDIDRNLRPRHTPGPVSIGMSSELPQPIQIREQNGDAYLDTVFGVTLENLWTDGDLDRVREFTVLIPEEFRLTKCDAEWDDFSESDPFCQEDPELCARDMNAYTFKNIGTPKTFKTITCRLMVDEGLSVENIIPIGQQKAQKSFIVKANYDYVLRDNKRTEVRELAR